MSTAQKPEGACAVPLDTYQRRISGAGAQALKDLYVARVEDS